MYYSNATPEFLAELSAKTARCPTCGQNSMRMAAFENQISTYLMEQNPNALAADSCILCVEKHIGDAMTLTKELMTASNSGTLKNGQITSSVNAYRNHVEIIGNLCEAAKESVKWTKLHDAILKAERQYRYNGVIPEWDVILAVMSEVRRSEK